MIMGQVISFLKNHLRKGNANMTVLTLRISSAYKEYEMHTTELSKASATCITKQSTSVQDIQRTRNY